MNVFVRWRPLASPETALGEFTRSATENTNLGQTCCISVADSASKGDSGKSWTSSNAFKYVLETTDDNAKAYDTIVAPAIPDILKGGSGSFFAYGHSGSGKTHSIVGYDFEDVRQLGLCLAAAKQLFTALQSVNADEHDEAEMLGIGFSLFELRKQSAFDLLNARAECHIREGSDGKVHFRGQTETLEDGKVRVRSIVQRSCFSYETMRSDLVHALSQRATGTSSTHDQSSRTHAVLELEIITKELIDARQAVVERQSELVPIGKHATDVYLEETMKGFVVKEGGGYEPNPAYKLDQERIDAAEAKKTEYEDRVAAAEQHVNNIIASSKHKCLGAKILFVDLAGAEYQTDGKGASSARQTPQERKEARQINTDLLALKEVIRAWSENRPHIPYRSSTLTMVLREHFANPHITHPSMIVTVSPARDQYNATMNSLKYGNLVGASTAR